MGSTRPGSVNVLVPSSEPSSGGTHQHQAVAVRQEDDATMRSSSPAPEADSSYGDMPFDMDALEETMKLYD
jgi:hypothetical protein